MICEVVTAWLGFGWLSKLSDSSKSCLWARPTFSCRKLLVICQLQNRTRYPQGHYTSRATTAVVVQA